VQIYTSSSQAGISPHPTKATVGESFLEGFTRSFVGFLLRDQKQKIEVD
jgi:hypothetical protein